MTSKITGGPVELAFKKTLLGKYNVQFYRCAETGFIQTEEPYWLNESYETAITKLDVGLVFRNQHLAPFTEELLIDHFDHDKRFLDYAGGYGLFTRMMRDKGFNFYHQDKYCANIFAEYHDITQLPANTEFELVTAFEVAEHLPEPVKGFKEMLQFSGNLFFSTEIQPVVIPEDWWYLSTETGQHISFYTIASLQYLANKFEKHFYSDGKGQHLFTVKKLASDPFVVESVPAKDDPYLVKKMREKLQRHDRRTSPPPPPPRLRKQSLIEQDWNEAKKRIASRVIK